MQKLEVKRKILIAHSPDADDAFMFYALAKNIIKSEKKYEFEHVLKDIQTLNQESGIVRYDVQAISFFAYPDVDDKYQLLSCGGSLGHGYGPLLIGHKDVTELELSKLCDFTIAVPGEKTTAFLLLKLLLKDFKYKVLPFDQILKAVSNGDCSLGLIIHEGQLSYLKYGLKKVIDLGEWWLGKTNLPVPLGGNVIRRTLTDFEKKEINSLIRESILYALKNKEKIISEISHYAREIETDINLVNKFVGMYVNDFTVDYGVAGKLAIEKLYQLAYKEKLISKMPLLDFVD